MNSYGWCDIIVWKEINMIKSCQGKNRNKKKQCHETYFLLLNTCHTFIKMKEFKIERDFLRTMDHINGQGVSLLL